MAGHLLIRFSRRFPRIIYGEYIHEGAATRAVVVAYARSPSSADFTSIRHATT